MAFDFKHASEADRKKEYDRIAKEIGDDNFFTKKELNYLPEALADGEQVLAFTSGFFRWEHLAAYFNRPTFDIS